MDDFLPREENPANDVYQDKSHSYFQHSLFYADGCKNISFSGLGKIDMRSVWEPDGSWQRAVKIFALKNCTDVVIKDLVLRNATDLAVYFAGCENVTVTGLNIFTHIDGISPDSCKNVVISDCIINSGDDGIVPKSSFTLGRFAAMENLTISNCIISSRCNAIKFGTESNTAFLNVTITGCTIYNTRFSGITLQAVDGATVNGFSVSGITMKNVGNPIMLMVLDRSRAPEGTPIGEIKNVSLSGITVTGPYEPWEAPTWNYKSHMEDDKVQCPVPAPVIMEMEASNEINLLTMTQEDFSKLLEAYPYWTQGVIPKGTYKAAKEDIHVISLWNFAVAHKDLPEDLVYDMTKATFEVLPQLANAVKDMAKTKPEDILYSSVPLHKGAIKYYREIGLTIPDKLIPAEAK